MGLLETLPSRFARNSIADGNPEVVFGLRGIKGKTWMVNSAAAAGGNGASWDSAVATLQAAVDLAAANDLILIAPGHAETVTATSVALNKAGLIIIGMGVGTQRPTFTFGAAAATVTVSAASIRISNCLFVANFVNVASAFTTSTAKDLQIVDCEFRDTSAILNFLCCVTTNATDNAADGLTFVGNYVWGLATTDGAVISVLAALDRLLATDNYVDKAATNDAGHFMTIAAKVIRAARIFRNQLNVVGSTGATVALFITGSSTTNTGMVALNFVTSLDTTTALLITAAINLAVHENYVSGVVAGSGTLYPAADNPA